MVAPLTFRQHVEVPARAAANRSLTSELALHVGHRGDERPATAVKSRFDEDQALSGAVACVSAMDGWIAVGDMSSAVRFRGLDVEVVVSVDVGAGDRAATGRFLAALYRSARLRRARWWRFASVWRLGCDGGFIASLQSSASRMR